MNTADNASINEYLTHVRIVMVNTTLPANIGSALRAMKTMGLSQLVLLHLKLTLILILMRWPQVRKTWLKRLKL